MLAIANYGRRIQGYDGRPDIFDKLEDPRKTLGHKNLFYDTLVHDSHTLDLLKKRVGVSQIIMGLDDPFPLGEVEGVGTSYPGRVVDYAHKIGILSEKESNDIWCDNVLNWLNMKKEDFV
jgi:aminocarboxymuconate-semialdehyde decarboxylase